VVRRERRAEFRFEDALELEREKRVGLFQTRKDVEEVRAARYVFSDKPFGDELRSMEPGEGKDLLRRANELPQLVVESRGRMWWLYKEAVYSTAEELEPDEVQALIEEKENKKRLRIARAKTVAAMADNLDRKGLRQPIPREVKVAVWQRDQGRCVQCGSNEELEFDHIVPVARGGSNTERNVQLLCAACNREKGASL
jgi:HNH endonuclease